MIGAMEIMMMKYLPILALLALPACLGGSGESTVEGVPDMSAEFGGLLNGVRMGSGEGQVFYQPVLTTAAQTHADDLLANNTLSIFLSGTTTDMGDTLNSLGYSWQDIGQMIAQGDFTTQSVLNEWAANGSQGDGGDADELTFSDYLDFGIAKAGSGSDARWVLILTNPS